MLNEYWDNLIYTNDAPDADGWGLRGHLKSEKIKGWHQMIILSKNCRSKQEATKMAEEFTKVYNEI